MRYKDRAFEGFYGFGIRQYGLLVRVCFTPERNLDFCSKLITTLFLGQTPPTSLVPRMRGFACIFVNEQSEISTSIYSKEMMTMRFFSSRYPSTVLCVVSLCILLFACAGGAFAQSQANAADVNGVVRDPQGAVVAGATVKVRNTATNFTRDKQRRLLPDHQSPSGWL